MSKKYQYFARKRRSHNFFEAISTCKLRHANNTTNCPMCLSRTGRTKLMTPKVL